MSTRDSYNINVTLLHCAHEYGHIWETCVGDISYIGNNCSQTLTMWSINRVIICQPVMHNTWVPHRCVVCMMTGMGHVGTHVGDINYVGDTCSQHRCVWQIRIMWYCTRMLISKPVMCVTLMLSPTVVPTWNNIRHWSTRKYVGIKGIQTIQIIESNHCSITTPNYTDLSNPPESGFEYGKMVCLQYQHVTDTHVLETTISHNLHVYV